IRADEPRAACDQSLHQAADPRRIGAGRPVGPAERPCYPRRPMRLIVTEKNNSAEKIAGFLSGGSATSDKTFKVPYYTWTDADGKVQRTIGLKGHVLGPAFPEGYSNWQKT